MSSSNDLFGPEDFENLIAAVESLDIPSDDESSSFPASSSSSDNVVNLSTAGKPQPHSGKATFEVDGDPFGDAESNSLSMQVNEDDEFSELDNLASDYSELDFDDAPDTFSPTTSFAAPSKKPATSELSLEPSPAKSSPVASFNVDDPFDSQSSADNSNAMANESAIDPVDAIDAIDDEDDLIDVYASFLETSDEASQSTVPPKQELDYFGDDGFEVFDGIAAANEVAALWDESHTNADQPSTQAMHNEPVKTEMAQTKPLHSTMAKTKMAADKLKAHLESLSTNTKATLEPVAPITPVENVEIKPLDEPVKATFEEELDPEFADLASHAAIEEPASQPLFEAREVGTEQPVASSSPAMSEAVSEKIKETVNLSRKTEVIEDNLLAAFVDSTLSSKQKIRAFSLQNFARKLPRVYLVCTTLLALVGFAYILAIPVLLAATMFNGFEMLNSPFTNDVVMLLLALFSISLFLFMVGYKLMDLKFVGPGGITLNHENATMLIDKIQKLQKERSIPKIHDIVLTRRHELNLIKIPRFGLPVWSKNVLAIGYPLLQTLPTEYFDVALTRRLTQFNKRKNLLHNWLSFMRRTWTIYAVSLKERKGVIDLLHYCFFAPYASIYRSFAVYVSQKDELLADEKALLHCNDRDLIKTAQTLRITRAMLLQYFWPKLNEDLQTNTAAPHYVQPYSKLPDTLNTLLRSKNVDAWFIRLGQEEVNPGDPEAPFALRMNALAQRKVAIPDAFDTNAAQHYFGDQYDKMTDLLNTLWAEDVQKELFAKNIHGGSTETLLPCHLAIEPA